MVGMAGDCEEKAAEERKTLRNGGAEPQARAAPSRVGTVALRRRADAEISRRLPQSRADMRRTSRRTLPYQGHRSHEEPANRARRTNRRRTDSCAETSLAQSKNYW